MDVRVTGEASRMTFSSPIDDRYFEDYVEGDVHVFGSAVVDADEQLAFSRKYDPQSIHVDPAAADKGPFGGIIASGWYTGCLMMRMLVDHFLTHNASMASPGVDELRWLKPVRPGDVLSVRATILKATPSRSKPDRGAVTTLTEVLNQHGEVVMSLTAVNIMGRRPVT
jgi:acyl dehydratase